jgi:hypothetical protein
LFFVDFGENTSLCLRDIPKKPRKTRLAAKPRPCQSQQMPASAHDQHQRPIACRAPCQPDWNEGSFPLRAFTTALIVLWSASSLAGSPKDSQPPQNSAPTAQLNTNKTFNLSLLKSGGAPVNSRKSFPTSPAPSFLTPKFEPKPNTALNRSFEAKSFTSSEFITGQSVTGGKTFTAEKTVPMETADEAGEASFLSKTGQAAAPRMPSVTIPTTPDALNQTYGGPEAQKKKIPYTPGNGPAGGVTFGRVLSVEEVKEILNKSK